MKVSIITSAVSCRAKKILMGYAQIFFCSRWEVGLVFFIATFIVPSHGISGLLGIVASNLAARLLGMQEDHIEEGYYAYNGLLTGLALGMTYRFNAAFALMLLLSSVLGVFTAAVLRKFSERYLFIPVLSLPFVITTWIAMAAGQNFGELIYATTPFEMEALKGVLPQPVEQVVSSLGAAFFQVNVPSALIISLGVLIFSRHAFVLAALSVIAGSFVYTYLGGNPAGLHQKTGFNFALTAIAAGGMFLSPGPRSYAIGIAGSVLSAVIAAGAAKMLAPAGLPVLAFPFLAATMIMLYALGGSRVIRTISVLAESPEKNLKNMKISGLRFPFQDRPSFDFPLSGRWTVTQGFNGGITHARFWPHAWDFEILDDDGRPYRNDGASVEDFYSWNMPVFSPGEGRVVRVVNNLDDNEIGHIDADKNWGNTVVIWHHGTVYTALSHLAKGSIMPVEGDIVSRGQLIARVGNSGRSPVPHLHFQCQSGFEIGSPTAPSSFQGYLIEKPSGQRFIYRGVPEKGDAISPGENDAAMSQIISFPIGAEWSFNTEDSGHAGRETWKSEVDFWGNRRLVCRETRSSVRFFPESASLTLIEHEGSRAGALLWFFLGLSRLPFTKKETSWEEELPADMIIGPARRAVFDFLEPFYQAASIKTESFMRHGNSGGFAVTARITHWGPLSVRKFNGIEITTTFDLFTGISRIDVVRDGQRLFTATRSMPDV